MSISVVKEGDHMPAKSYYQQRAEELKILIATVKIKHRLTDRQLAKKLDMPLGTFNDWKSDIGRFHAEKVWMLERMAQD